MVYMDTEINMIIWNSSRSIVKITCSRDSCNRDFKIRLAKTLDATPLAICGTYSVDLVNVTWPWGKVDNVFIK